MAVNSGGTLGGTGIISGSVTVKSGGHIAPGTSVGTLTQVHSIWYAAQLKILNSTEPRERSDYGHRLRRLSRRQWTAFNCFWRNVGRTTPGTYKLIGYSGIFNGGTPLDSSWTTASGANAHVLDRIGGLTYSFNTTSDPGFLDLVIGGTPPSSWIHNGDGNWGDAANWSNGSVNSIGATRDFRHWRSRTVNAATVNINLETQKTAGGIIFSNGTTSYN